MQVLNLSPKYIKQITVSTPTLGYAIKWQVGDLNHDNIPDLLFGGSSWTANATPVSPGKASLYAIQSQGAGNLKDITNIAFPNNPVNPETNTLVSGDFNKDGYSDFIVAATGGEDGKAVGAYSHLYLSDGKDGYVISEIKNDTLGFGYFHHVDMADINNDGFVDFVFVTASVGSGYTLINNGGKSFTLKSDGLPEPLINPKYGEVVSSFSDGYWQKVYRQQNQTDLLTDINRDGNQDLVVFLKASPYGVIYLNDGQGNFNKSNPIKFDDAVKGWLSGGYFDTYTHTVGTTDYATISTIQGANIYDAVKYDINGDGYEDVIAVCTRNDYSVDRYNHGIAIKILINNGTTLVDETETRISTIVSNEVANHNGYSDQMTLCDLNGDGYMDFLVERGSFAEPLSNQLNPDKMTDTRFFLNDGKGKYNEVSLNGLPNSQYAVMPIDGKLAFVGIGVNKDVRPDVATLDTWTTTVPWTIGTDGNDYLYGTQIDDLVDGKQGIDTFIALGRRTDYLVKNSNSNYSIQLKDGVEGVDQLKNVERIKFYDQKVAIDLQSNQNGGMVVKTIGAVFGADAIKTHPEWVGLGLQILDGGMTYNGLMSLALNFVGLNTPEAIVSKLWANVIGTVPTVSDKKPFIDMLASGMAPGDLGVLAADTSFNLVKINLTGLQDTGVVFV